MPKIIKQRFPVFQKDEPQKASISINDAMSADPASVPAAGGLFVPVNQRLSQAMNHDSVQHPPLLPPEEFLNPQEVAGPKITDMEGAISVPEVPAPSKDMMVAVNDEPQPLPDGGAAVSIAHNDENVMAISPSSSKRVKPPTIAINL
jgi:hypothetical protein